MATLRRRFVRSHPDTRGEAIPAVMLYLGVIFTVLIGVHLIVVAMARTAIQSAADAAVLAAQGATPNTREAEGILAARISLAAAHNTVRETLPPAIIVEEGKGVVQALVFAGAISPIIGEVELTALACGPLDDLTADELTSSEPWGC